MPRFTLQDAFDRAVRGLLLQGRQSRGESPGGNVCLYRNPEGLKCVAGWLIDEEYYYKGLEHKGCDTSAVQIAIEESGFPVRSTSELRFYLDGQEIHDNSSVASWPNAYRSLAREHGLSAAVIDEFGQGVLK